MKNDMSNNLESLLFYASTEKIKNSISEFESEPINKDEMQFLKMYYPDFPVIPVENKCYLLAVNSTSFTGLVWIASWFETVSVYMDKNISHYVRLKIHNRVIEVDCSMLYPKDITGLAKYGIVININHANEISRYLFKKILKLDIEEQMQNIGFVEYSEKLIFNAYDKEILAYTSDTDINEYAEELNKLLTNIPIMFALSCGCSSLFLAYLSMKCNITLQSFIISFYGKTTTGKSTAQTLMTSVYSKPDDNKVYIPFFGTLNAIVKNMANKFGIPQIFDEATVSSLNMENLLYTITLEHDKSRCNSNSTLKDSDTWKTIVITSSENRLLSETHMHNKGLDARLLSFNDLRYTDSSEHSEQIHNFCVSNYGILGKTLAEYLINTQPEKIVEIYTNCKDSIRKAIGEGMFFELTERLINEYALILMSANILTDFGIKIDIKGVIDILVENHNEIAERSNIAEKYYNYLMNYVAMNPFSSSIKIDNNKNTVAFIDETFLKVLTSHGASNTDLVIKELDAEGYIYRRKEKSIKNRLRFNGTLVNCYEIYRPTKEENQKENNSLEFILENYEGIEE